MYVPILLKIQYFVDSLRILYMHTYIYITHAYNIYSYYIHPLLLFLNPPRSITYLLITLNTVFCILSLLSPIL